TERVDELAILRVFTLRADVDMEITRPLRTDLTGQVDLCDASFLVSEEGRRITVTIGVVDLSSQVYGRLPGEVVVRVVAVGDPDIPRGRSLDPTEAHRAAGEAQPVPIRREIRSETQRGVDVWPQVARRAPGVVQAATLRDPEVIRPLRAKTTWAIRSDVEAQ